MEVGGQFPPHWQHHVVASVEEIALPIGPAQYHLVDN